MNSADEPVLQVAAKGILVNRDGKILILREAGESYAEGTNAGKYHAAAGGRINPSESYADGLKREVAEETGITEFTPLYPVFVGEWWPVIKGVPRHIVAIFTVCETRATKVRLSEEHDDFRWILPEECDQYDILDAELEAIAAYVKRKNAKLR